jgi:two-component system nitrate/nitrite response regulator NarL
MSGAPARRRAATRGGRASRREAAAARPEKQRLRVLIADHSPALRAGVRMSLESSECVVCAEAEDAIAALEAALRDRPDVCLVDASLPGGAIAVVEEISWKLPDCRVVVFGDSRDAVDVLEALRAGASGYLLKDIDLAPLPTTLQRVLAGEAALPRALVGRLIESLHERERRRRLAVRHDLTNREIEVLELLAEKLTTAEIARRLFVAKVTVRTHVASILKKLGAADRQAAIRLVRQR